MVWRTLVFLVLINYAFISILNQYTDYTIPFITFELPELPFYAFIVIFIVAGIVFGYDKVGKKKGSK